LLEFNYYTLRFDCHKLPIFTLMYDFSATYLHGDTYIADSSAKFMLKFYLYEEIDWLLVGKSRSSLPE